MDRPGNCTRGKFGNIISSEQDGVRPWGGCMLGSKLAQPLLVPFVLAGILLAETPAKVDFGKDVLPILRQNCVSCHGPAQQSSGLRLDRKSSVLGHRGIVPGTSAN